jgi:hypothetical protein
VLADTAKSGHQAAQIEDDAVQRQSDLADSPSVGVSSGAGPGSPLVLATFCRRFSSCFFSRFCFFASSRWRFSYE